jgi:hypothetical protein
MSPFHENYRAGNHIRSGKNTVRARIFDTLCASPHGISCKALIEQVYADDPDGGPEWADTCMHATISTMRKILRETYPLLHIESMTGRRYHLVIRK